MLTTTCLIVKPEIGGNRVNSVDRMVPRWRTREYIRDGWDNRVQTTPGHAVWKITNKNTYACALVCAYMCTLSIQLSQLPIHLPSVISTEFENVRKSEPVWNMKTLGTKSLWRFWGLERQEEDANGQSIWFLAFKSQHRHPRSNLVILRFSSKRPIVLFDLSFELLVTHYLFAQSVFKCIHVWGRRAFGSRHATLNSWMQNFA